MLHSPTAIQRVRLQAAAIDAFGLPNRPVTRDQMALAQRVELLGWVDQVAAGRVYALATHLDAYLTATSASPARIDPSQLALASGEALFVAAAALGLLGYVDWVPNIVREVPASAFAAETLLKH